MMNLEELSPGFTLGVFLCMYRLTHADAGAVPATTPFPKSSAQKVQAPEVDLQYPFQLNKYLRVFFFLKGNQLVVCPHMEH